MNIYYYIKYQLEIVLNNVLSAFTDLTSCSTLMGFVALANNEQLTGSSIFNENNGYDRSRLNTVYTNGLSGGWQAAVTSVGEYIQADLGTVRRLENVVTQGWFSNSNFYWVTSYRFAYSIDGASYTFVSNPDGSDKIFTGNTDNDTLVQHDFDPALVARYVRLHPQTWNRAIALRWDVTGCDIGMSLVLITILHQ